MRNRIVEPQMDEMGQPYHLKYRPRDFSEVRGQDAVVSSLQKMLKGGAVAHAYLFSGPSGCGKTTLARILCDKLDIQAAGVTEVDAASNTGIDAMRDLVAPLRYKGFGNAPKKGVVIDECHRLSKQAWDSLLKIVEEPPEHVFFFFCTTEVDKVPAAIVTRCAAYSLKRSSYDDLMDLLELVVDAERLEPIKGLLPLIAKASDGSPRLALVNLGKTNACEDLGEAEILLESPSESKEVIDLCRALIKNDLDWQTLTKTLKAMPETPAETVRILICNYMASCAMGARTDKEAIRILGIMECFATPYPASDKLAPLLVSFGRYIFP